MFHSFTGVSIETGFDWTHTSEAVMSETITTDVTAEVPAGTRLTIGENSRIFLFFQDTQ